ncbi:UDP-glycosyltransferase UGT5-like [Wyeomyia smithii]|uniref:UDP-glycosyltransferase UGT5-like n=1 Tax=Wyeomyia smithii TaxID=174621 RepID=UPI002467EA99|nr:UDP-glycosyltransferase UGT5-like [Wyeomyia smithii]
MWIMLMLPVVVVFIGQLLAGCRSANVLYISGVASPSHFLWSQRLFEHLARLGHNMTVVNLYKHGLVRDVHLIKLDGVAEALAAEEEDYIEFGQMNSFETLMSFSELELFVCELSIKSEGFKTLFSYPKEFQFDLVVHDHLAGPCLLVLLTRFDNPPLVMASAFNGLSTTVSALGSPMFPGFIPNQVNDVDSPMSFFQRSYNFLLFAWEIASKAFIYKPQLDELIKSQLNLTHSTASLERQTLLVILNSNPVLERAEPKLPNVVQAGGLHIMPPKNLPAHILNAINGSSNGAIFFSLGTNARSDHLSNTILCNIITAMERLPSLLFLWKVEHEDRLPMKLPGNVLTAPWFPQNDLLAHSKLRLFITHGGLLSEQEAAWHGVPMLGLPIYADQFDNVNQMVRKGVARRLEIRALSAQQMVDCIEDLLTNESYKNNAARLSKLLQDQKEHPLELAAWSIEWVLRNVNSSELWNRSLHQYGFFEKHSFDVVIFFAFGSSAVVLLLVLLLYKILLLREAFSKMKTD